MNLRLNWEEESSGDLTATFDRFSVRIWKLREDVYVGDVFYEDSISGIRKIYQSERPHFSSITMGQTAIEHRIDAWINKQVEKWEDLKVEWNGLET